MNHVYRVIFNRSLGVYQCVSEIAKSRGKASGKSQITKKTALTLKGLVIAMMGLSGSAMAEVAVYDDGQIHKFDESIAINGDVIISGTGTTFQNPDHQINFGTKITGQTTTPPTNVLIKNHASVEAGMVVLLVLIIQQRLLLIMPSLILN